MSSDTSLRRFIRRLKLAERSGPLVRRDRAVLPFIEQTTYIPSLLLDTTVYIDQFQDKFPSALETVLNTARVWHSPVTASELSLLVGLLDPRHPGTAAATEEILGSIGRRPPTRIVIPDPDTWAEAGVLAGLLARLQQYPRPDRCRTLNAALLYLSALKSGLAVLTRNHADFDLLDQLCPKASVLFYDPA